MRENNEGLDAAHGTRTQPRYLRLARTLDRIKMIDLLPGLVAQSLDFLKDPPVSTIFLMVLAFAVSALTTYISKRYMNVKEYRKSMEESSHAQQELMAAMRSGNQSRIQKAQRRQKESQQTQMKHSSAQMKTSMYTIIPIMIMWQILGGFYGRSIGVAWMPFDPIFFGTKLNFITWYIICSFTASIIMRRVFGLSFEIEPKN